MEKSKRKNNILTVMKKELRRFFGDRRMLMSIILPGVLIYVIYSLMGGIMADTLMGGGEDTEYRVLLHNESEIVHGITLDAGLNMTYYKCPDCTEEHSQETITEALGNGSYNYFLNGNPNSRNNAKPSSSVFAVVTKVMFIPSSLVMLSMLISGKMICSWIPSV